MPAGNSASGILGRISANSLFIRILAGTRRRLHDRIVYTRQRENAWQIAGHRERFTGKTALVTGASAGLGRDLANCLPATASSGIVARNEQKLQDLAAQLRERHGVTVDVIVQDLAAADASTRIFDRLQGKTIDIS